MVLYVVGRLRALRGESVTDEAQTKRPCFLEYASPGQGRIKARTCCVTKLILPSCYPFLEAFGVAPRNLYPLLQRVCTHVVGHVGSRDGDDRYASS